MTATEKKLFTLYKMGAHSSFDDLAKCELFVAANRNEMQMLYNMYSMETENRLTQRVYTPRNDWKWNHYVFTIKVGYIGPEELKLEVALNFRFADIDGKKVAFYSADGRYADWEMIDEWLNLNFNVEKIGDVTSLFYRWNNLFNKIR